MQEGELRLGAMAIVVCEGKILVVQLNEYKDGDWAFPGGGKNAGETDEECITRELQEELGLNKEDFEIVFKSPFPHIYYFPPTHIVTPEKPYSGQKKEQFLVLLRSSDSVFPNSNEIKKIKWVEIDKIKTVLRFPGQFENFVKFFNSIPQELKEKLGLTNISFELRPTKSFL